MKAFLENFASILGAATLALLLMSVSHEYGYFWAVGRFFQTFLTTSDYFSNAVLWLPATLILVYLATSANILWGPQKFPQVGFQNVKAIWNFAMLAVVSIVCPAVVFFFAKRWNPFAYLTPLLPWWMIYGSKILPLAETSLEIQAQRMLLIAPVVMAGFFGGGFEQGKADLSSFNEPYTLEMKKGGNLHRIVLRSFDKGILVRDAVEKRIEFVRWEDITKISRLEDADQSQPLSCS
jgi:hypothetical protein